MTTQKFTILQYARNKVSVKNVTGAWTDEITSREAMEISKWVEQSQVGHRVAYDMWQLDSKEAILLFTIRWEGCDKI